VTFRRTDANSFLKGMGDRGWIVCSSVSR